MGDRRRPFEFAARVRREPLTGAVSLDLIRDEDPVELMPGDEFVTVALAIDPFEPVP